MYVLKSLDCDVDELFHLVAEVRLSNNQTVFQHFLGARVKTEENREVLPPKWYFENDNEVEQGFDFEKCTLMGNGVEGQIRSAGREEFLYYAHCVREFQLSNRVRRLTSYHECFRK